MKRSTLFFFFFSTFLAFSQFSTFDLLKKLQNNESLPRIASPIDKNKVIKSLKSFKQVSQLLQTVRQPNGDTSPVRQLNLGSLGSLDNFNQPTVFNDFVIYYDSDFKVPRFVFPKNSSAIVEYKYRNFLLSNSFFSFIDANKSLFKLQNPSKELTEVDITRSTDGEIIIRYQQNFKQIPIWGKELIARFNSNGELVSINCNLAPAFVGEIPTQPEISADFAIEKAIADLKKRTVVFEIPQELKNIVISAEPKATLFYYKEKIDAKPRLVWVVEIRPNIWERYRYFVDAKTSEIVEFYQTNPSDGPTVGSGIDLFGQNRTLNIFLSQGRYYLVDASKPMFNQNVQSPNGVIVTYSNNNTDLTKDSKPMVVSSNTTTFSDPVAVSLHYHLGKVYDYYYSTFGRNSIDNNKKNVVGIIHITSNGESMANAFWSGDFLAFGDGGSYFQPLAKGLDVVAHEFTHGVVQFTVDLEYKFQSGALNEGFADWGGAMVDREDWLIGEDVVKPNYFPSGAMRDMSDPHNKAFPGDPNWLPAHMSEYQDLPLERDNGGVHINVGIINKATYLIGNAIGKDKLEKIYYRVLDKRYLIKQANFVDFRIACERSAKELFGDNSPELAAVRNAFDAVGIGSSGSSNPGKDLPPVSGKHFLLAVDGTDHYLWRLEEKLTTQQDIIKISRYPVFTESGSVVTVSEDGTSAFYIDFTNNVHSINLLTLEDTLLTTDGVFRSIAISGGQNPKIAATTIDYSPLVYIYDIRTDSTKIINLYTPNTSHTPAYTQPLFAVNLSWSPSGKYLVYDAINVRYELNGDTTYVAEVNLLEPESGTIIRIIPPMPTGIHIASPMFSQTSDNRLSFVVWDVVNQVGAIYIGDLFSGNVSTLTQFSLATNQGSTSVFSPNDTAIVIQFYNPQLFTTNLYKLKLNQDKMTPNGSPYLYATNAGIPRWFAQGIRNEVVASESRDNFNLYPNPSGGTIIVDLFGGNTDFGVKVFDLLGTLINVTSIRSGNKVIVTMPENAKSGPYLLQIESDMGKAIKSFLFIRN